VKKYEFKQVFTRDLVQYGKQGWNICCASESINGYTHSFWMSREIEEERKVPEFNLPETANPEWIEKNKEALSKYFSQTSVLPTGE
jgi:hypothetical protein